MKLKVDGSGNQWYVWQFNQYWEIVGGPYLTKSRANKELNKLLNLQKNG